MENFMLKHADKCMMTMVALFFGLNGAARFDEFTVIRRDDVFFSTHHVFICVLCWALKC